MFDSVKTSLQSFLSRRKKKNSTLGLSKSDTHVPTPKFDFADMPSAGLEADTSFWLDSIFSSTPDGGSSYDSGSSCDSAGSCGSCGGGD